MNAPTAPDSYFVLSAGGWAVESRRQPLLQPQAGRQRLGQANPHLPPHLREVCALLATGLLRLRSRTAEDLARDAAIARASGEVSLHFCADPSGAGAPPTRSPA